MKRVLWIAVSLLFAFVAVAQPQPGAKVARMWRGRVPNARADKYQKYLDESGVQKLRAIKDNLGVQMLRRDLGDGSTEFVVISYWPNRDAIHAYAGAEIEKVHDLPRDKDFLIDPEKTVRHYDIQETNHGRTPTDASVACAQAKDKSLCGVLIGIADRDQMLRDQWTLHPNDQSVIDKTMAADREDLIVVEALIAKYGWPGKTLAGTEGSTGAWLVIQHAPLDVQKKYLEMMTKAADAGELPGEAVAKTVDRIRIREGKPQLYGSQFHEVNGAWVPFPIEDEANVDARRAKLGMPSMAEQTKLMGETYKKP